MRILDLFCGGGGAAMGYARAGWEVLGVDLIRQHDYPFEFVLGDALTFPLEGWDAIHASPPCKPFSTAGKNSRNGARLFDPHPDLLAPMFERLATVEVPWIVENVVGAPMPPGSVMLCGSSFGLDVRRHRLFASNVAITAPPCDHAWQTPRFTLDLHRHRGGQLASVVGVYGNLHGDGDSWELRQRAMGIDWLTGPTLNQAIPPAYTEHLGRQLIHHCQSAAQVL